MRRTPIILCWLLLLVPTLLIGGVTVNLLRREKENLAMAAVSAAAERAQIVADNVALTIREVEEGLTEHLASLKESELAEVLPAWERKNPLVRNVFIWGADGRTLLPDPGQPLTSEERGFLQRYDALFAGRIPWERPGEEAGVSSYARQSGGVFESRRQLKKLASKSYTKQQAAEVAVEKPEDVRSGWIPWFSENRLHLLGWVSKRAGGPVFGVEMETMAVLSRLLTAMPPGRQTEEIYALLDGEGTIMYQSGGMARDEQGEPLASRPVGRVLPHWQVAIYSGGNAGAVTGRSFMILTALLVGIFVVAILSGGSLLLWQAHRNMRDALQKTTFVSNVSHEFKTPLTTIRMYAEMLGEGRVKEEGKREEYLRVITDQSQRLTRLVNNVLDFSRLEQHRKKYRFEPVDLVQLLTDILETHSMRFEEVGMTLTPRIFGKAPKILADRDALEQVILNLLDNAIKYAADGKELLVELKFTEKTCILSIQDRGPGVPASQRQRIFEKFHRMDDSLTAKQAGCGLGLSIARRLVRDHGGDLQYKARHNGGSTFIVTLPLRTEAES